MTSLDSVIVPFENQVKSMLTEYKDVFKPAKQPKKRSIAKQRPHY